MKIWHSETCNLGCKFAENVSKVKKQIVFEDAILVYCKEMEERLFIKTAEGFLPALDKGKLESM